MTVLLGLPRFPPSNREKGETARTLSSGTFVGSETPPRDESREKAQVKVPLPKEDNFALVFSLKKGPCDLGSLSVLVDHDRAAKGDHGRAVLVVAGGLDSDDTDIPS